MLRFHCTQTVMPRNDQLFSFCCLSNHLQQSLFRLDRYFLFRFLASVFFMGSLHASDECVCQKSDTNSVFWCKLRIVTFRTLKNSMSANGIFRCLENAEYLRNSGSLVYGIAVLRSLDSRRNVLDDFLPNSDSIFRMAG